MKDYKKILLSRIDLKILYLIIIILFSILTFRTVHYIRQVPLINKAIIYQSYNTSSKNLGTLNMGDRVTVLSTKYHWKKVKTSEGEVGWIQDWNFQQQNKITSLSDATIIIDAGHGGSDSGALSRTNKNEKTYTLIYAKKLAERLRKAGAMVYMTRDDDSFVSLNSRPRLAENVHADAFISIHFDSAPENNMGSGYTTYYYHKKTSLRLAQDINSKLKYLKLENRGVEFGDFLVIRENTVPAVLLEMGYINSDRDFERITSTSYQDSVADDIKQGLDTYFDQN
ncbi:N-acetylmuramoyl-L-alanine amidase [Ligilactobacillus salivarius]|uniref:Probable cell wall amidase lytH n=1 Tax=Ligilactobacillus salivarius TaxID=1624 RepID=A0AB36MI89_9LACO|nr:N-acetylmuramoyl-L-alanine amidase [Ligilactobacillus salivarius]OUN18922.1 N-acetylmuramoyl-L-alanine amidase [Ligilactobacillus salivarius]